MGSTVHTALPERVGAPHGFCYVRSLFDVDFAPLGILSRLCIPCRVHLWIACIKRQTHHPRCCDGRTTFPTSFGRQLVRLLFSDPKLYVLLLIHPSSHIVLPFCKERRASQCVSMIEVHTR